jgi:hypothetical protein
MTPREEMERDRRFRVAVNGLPHFCQKLSQLLRGDENWVVPYRSYTPFGLAARLSDVARCDLAFSWGARISMGRFLWAARSLRKGKVVMLWSGSDALFAKGELAEGKLDPWVVNRVHWAVSPWLAKEVRELGVDCEYVQVSFVEAVGPCPLPKKFSVLAYTPSLKKAELYGLKHILDAARKLPSVEFTLVGLEEGRLPETPPNLKVFGRVELAPFYEKTTVLLRPVQHDGLSFMVLESLARGRHVLYSQPLPGCVKVTDASEACRELEHLYALHASGRLEPNEAGRQYVERDYNCEKVRSQVLRRWKQIIETPEEEFRRTSAQATP